MPHEPEDHRRAPRPPLTRATFYRTAVPVLLIVLAVVTVVVLLLAGGVLFGIIPYPGR
jgi:hypothetical protein